MAVQEDEQIKALWRFLDHVIDAYALSHDVDDDAANFAMLAAHAVSDRLALSERVIDMMGQSALAEARRRKASRAPLAAHDRQRRKPSAGTETRFYPTFNGIAECAAYDD